MTTQEYKKKLVAQYNQTVITMHQLQGAIAACDELLTTEDDELIEDESDA